MKTSARNFVLKVLDKKPNTFSSSIVLNILGYQIFRIIFYNIYRIARIPKSIPKEHKVYVKELEKNGVCVIPNFLPNQSFSKLSGEYEQLENKFKREEKNLALPYIDYMNFYNESVSDEFRNFFLNDQIINNVSLSFLNRRLNLPLSVRLAKIYLKDTAEANLPHNGGTNNLHADTPMRTLKIFYYVTNTDESNAALKYCLGSNKMTLSRLWIEYKMSIRFSLNKWKINPNGEYQIGEPWVEMSKSEEKKLDLKPESLQVKANTLVMVDISGFHLRGEFKSLIPRKTIELNYRPIDTLRNSIYPIEKLLRSK
ncbi:MAG: hypothetical protein ACI9BF_000168 [Candidatus Paceibacteria bacterium]|jgi:hypothetical protein